MVVLYLGEFGHVFYIITDSIWNDFTWVWLTNGDSHHWDILFWIQAKFCSRLACVIASHWIGFVAVFTGNQHQLHGDK